MAQTISYEISLALFLFVFFLFIGGFGLNSLTFVNSINFILGSPVCLLLFVSIVAETNRTPFDFAEGESELVSGFNTEFGGGLFALIFIAEYGIIVFFSYLLSMIIFGRLGYSGITLIGGQIFLFSWI